MKKKPTYVICDCPEMYLIILKNGCKRCGKKEKRGGNRNRITKKLSTPKS